MAPPDDAAGLIERRPKRKKRSKKQLAKKRATGVDGQLAAVQAEPKVKTKSLRATPAEFAARIAPGRRWAEGIDIPVTLWLVLVHVSALAAPFFFTWKGLAICAFLCWFTGSIGVCLGYHRALTHGSFSTYRPVRWLLAFIAQLSGEGSALNWVANHRKHHMYSDQDGDPHSPRDGKWWSHVLWICIYQDRAHYKSMHEHYAPDLLKDPVFTFLDYMFLPSHFIMAAALCAWGWLGWDWRTGVSFMLWGMSVRLIYVLHVTWFVNSASHIWGYRNYETSDDSRNLWWVGLLAFGEGWHNNHHAFQRMAKHGHKWWELDVTYRAICVLEKLGLVWNVVHDIPKNAKPA